MNAVEIEEVVSELARASLEAEQFRFASLAASGEARRWVLLDAVKQQASARSIPYQRFIREALEKEVSRK